MLASKKMKGTIKYRNSSCMPREVIDRPLLLREIGRTTSFCIIYPTLLATYIYNMYKISYNYNPLAIEINFHMVFSGFIDDVVKKESHQFLLNCFDAILW